MRKRAMERLASQIAEADHERRRARAHLNEDRLTDAEHAFVVLADSRGKSVLRWPDFLVSDEAGGMIGVEVKTGKDRVSQSQALMFAALERHGLRVVVWSPERPTVLVPWRKHLPPRGPESAGSHPRQRVQGRVKTGERG